MSFKLKEGDIIRATRVSEDEDGKGRNTLKRVSWGKALEYQPSHQDYRYVDWLIVTHHPFVENEDTADDIVQEGVDKYTIVPLDELPDHVCVALAKRALLND